MTPEDDAVDSQDLFRDERFPRANAYAASWIKANAMGAHTLWLTEWLTGAMNLQPGMRVLDLGCGRGLSSIFLAKEYQLQVWATDLWVPASDNALRIRDAACEPHVFPLHADAHALPFAAQFFDAIVCVDAYSYFGTDDLYLNYLVNFLKEGGQLGIAGAGLTRELEAPPAHLLPIWGQDFWALHSSAWWRRHWERTGLLTIEVADDMPQGAELWLRWQQTAFPENTAEIDCLRADAGRTLTYVRSLGTRRPGQELVDYCWPDTLRSMPADYSFAAFLRDQQEPPSR